MKFGEVVATLGVFIFIWGMVCVIWLEASWADVTPFSVIAGVVVAVGLCGAYPEHAGE